MVYNMDTGRRNDVIQPRRQGDKFRRFGFLSDEVNQEHGFITLLPLGQTASIVKALARRLLAGKTEYSFNICNPLHSMQAM